MFSIIFVQELRYWFKNPSFYIFMFIFLVASMFLAAISAGIFDSATATTGSSIIVNSPIAIARMFMGLTSLSVFLFPSIIGVAVYRDYKSGMHSLLYSYPFSKANFLFAKFFSGVLIVALIISMIGVGLFVGFRLPGTNQDLLGAFKWGSYLQTYLVFLLPNILFYGAIVFGVVAFTRNIAAGFIAVIILTILNGTMELFLTTPDHMYLGAMLDPFGGSSMNYIARYWTVLENNTRSIPIKGIIIYNRLLWFAIAILIFGGVYRFFTFSQMSFSFSFRKQKVEQPAKQNLGGIIKVELPKAQLKFNWLQQLRITWRLSTIDFKYIIKSIPFLSILVIGLVIMIIEYYQLGDYQGTPQYPVTWKMANFSEAYLLAIHICTFLYAGMLVHRAKIAKINQLLDIMPIPNQALLLSKLLALIKMQLVMLTLAMIAGIGFQVYHGYYQIEIDQYIVSLYGFTFVYFLVWALMAVFIQTIVKNPYIGLFVLMIILLATPMLSLVGIEQALFKYGQGLGYNYSDMDGYGTYATTNFIYSTYWLMAGFIFLLLSSLFMVRGLPQSIQEHFRIAKSRLTTKVSVILLVLMASYLSLGFTIYQENNVDNIRTSTKQGELLQVGWEKKYKKYEDYPQPRIVAVKTEMNIFPKDRDFNAIGTYTMVNKSNEVIDSVFIKYTDYPTTLALNKPNSVLKDSLFGFDVFKLNNSMLPGDSLELRFTVRNKHNTFLRNNSPIIGNGTKITNKELYPSLGYTTAYELKDNPTREKHGLPPNPLKPHPSDTTALNNHMMSRDADWIDYEAIISTSENQTAITSGYLLREWKEEGRRYFHYKMDLPILNFYSFSSGRYEVVKDTWKDIALEIYYHKGHEYNLDRMMKGMKAGLAYNSENFSPYQFKQVRIIEFPRTAGNGAQGFPNTIPFSEGHGFIADVNDSDDGGIDYPFAVTVHEVAHQWWAHQVIGADVLGSSMLSESLSDYVRLKVIEHQQGKSKMRTYLKYSLDGYLRKRGSESRRENPLMFNDGQGYIRYQKGALVFYAISDYIGEKVLNQALKKYVEKVRFQQPPYTTTIEMVDYIREVTPDSLRYTIEDMFEKITLYNNEAINFTTTALDNGQFRVAVEFNVSKYRNDEKGRIRYSDNQTDSLSYQHEGMLKPQFSLPLEDYIDIGIFGEVEGEEVELYLKKHKITAINNRLTIIVDQKPVEVGVDPYNKLIDANPRDNRKGA